MAFKPFDEDLDGTTGAICLPQSLVGFQFEMYQSGSFGGQPGFVEQKIHFELRSDCHCSSSRTASESSWSVEVFSSFVGNLSREQK